MERRAAITNLLALASVTFAVPAPKYDFGSHTGYGFPSGYGGLSTTSSNSYSSTLSFPISSDSSLPGSGFTTGTTFVYSYQPASALSGPVESPTSYSFTYAPTTRSISYPTSSYSFTFVSPIPPIQSSPSFTYAPTPSTTVSVGAVTGATTSIPATGGSFPPIHNTKTLSYSMSYLTSIVTPIPATSLPSSPASSTTATNSYSSRPSPFGYTNITSSDVSPVKTSGQGASETTCITVHGTTTIVPEEQSTSKNSVSPITGSDLPSTDLLPYPIGPLTTYHSPSSTDEVSPITASSLTIPPYPTRPLSLSSIGSPASSPPYSFPPVTFTRRTTAVYSSPVVPQSTYGFPPIYSSYIQNTNTVSPLSPTSPLGQSTTYTFTYAPSPTKYVSQIPYSTNEVSPVTGSSSLQSTFSTIYKPTLTYSGPLSTNSAIGTTPAYPCSPDQSPICHGKNQILRCLKNPNDQFYRWQYHACDEGHHCESGQEVLDKGGDDGLFGALKGLMPFFDS